MTLYTIPAVTTGERITLIKHTISLGHLQPRRQQALPRRFFRAGAQNAQSRPQEPVFRRLEPKLVPAYSGRTGGAGASGFGTNGLRARRVSDTRLVVLTNASVSRGESMARMPPVSLLLMPHGRHGDAPLPPCVHTAPGYKKQPLPRLWPHRPQLRRRALCLSPRAQPPTLFPLSPRALLPETMAERFPGEWAAANGFGRRSLHEWEAYLLFEANIPAPPNMRVGPSGWRLSAGGVPICPVPDVDARPDLFAAEVDHVCASMTDEQRALPQYAAGNHGAWAAYFQHWQAQRIASTNGAPTVRGRQNNEGRRLWWGAPGRSLHAVLQHLEGGNDPSMPTLPPRPGTTTSGCRGGWRPLLPPPPVPPRRGRRRCSTSRPSPARHRSAGEHTTPASSSTMAGAPPPRPLPASSSRRRSPGSPR
ncbi:uncharacterized protein [Triticum aestivum]|uniref:uncharacterized protein n=1 Tax=Triticum aestivum TaxID=4565 RepID=UPI001D028855|nr:uncharacterized protein LOC123072045 [Triticum aestivum]XP_044351541.1 uncharacterized protein LOC123072045 [Triticum aestivum]XP_044351542.1 uncharacterized protein LOC123072045 [Triticum aestivum]